MNSSGSISNFIKKEIYKKNKMSKTESNVNWVEKGAVTPIKNQGQCGSCWAFSVTEQIESQYILEGNVPWELSTQQVTSCTANVFGCAGGDTTNGYEQLISGYTKVSPISGKSMKTFGLASAAMVPYTQSMYDECLSLACTVACTDEESSRVSTIGNLTKMVPEEGLTGPYVSIIDWGYGTDPCVDSCENQNLDLLNSYLSNDGPLSICVNAANWNDYVGGIMTIEGCGDYSYGALDHCVQLVGYNISSDNPYYLVRNSWATNWGEDGYIRLSAKGNTCGLSNEATFVVIE